jgi:hypothetical protein
MSAKSKQYRLPTVQEKRRNQLNPVPIECLEFSRKIVDKPLVYTNYGKVSAKRHILEKNLREKRIEKLF